MCCGQSRSSAVSDCSPDGGSPHTLTQNHSHTCHEARKRIQSRLYLLVQCKRTHVLAHMSQKLTQSDSRRLLAPCRGDVNCMNSFGRTALHIAAERRNGGIDVVQLLLAAGADLRARDILNQTPLHAASKSLNAEVSGSTSHSFTCFFNCAKKNKKIYVHTCAYTRMNPFT